MPIKMIVATDMNNAIGNAEGKLLYHLPKDLRYFKSITSRKHVVMGRKTWESLPVKPLPNRRNYVLTMNEDYVAEGATVLHHTDEVHELAKTKDVFIIGGAEIYYQFIDDVDELYVTHIHHLHPHAKAHFPDFGYKDWQTIGTNIKHEVDKNHEHSFTFSHYKKKEFVAGE